MLILVLPLNKKENMFTPQVSSIVTLQQIRLLEIQILLECLRQIPCILYCIWLHISVPLKCNCVTNSKNHSLLLINFLLYEVIKSSDLLKKKKEECGLLREGVS